MTLTQNTPAVDAPLDALPAFVTQIEVTGTLTPTELVRSLITDEKAARHVYALLGAVLTNKGIIEPHVCKAPEPEHYVSPADREAASTARRTKGTKEREMLLMGLAVRAMRINARMDRKTLAAAAGIGYSSLAGIETGAKAMSMDMIDKIADALGVLPHALVTYAENL